MYWRASRSQAAVARDLSSHGRTTRTPPPAALAAAGGRARKHPRLLRTVHPAPLSQRLKHGLVVEQAVSVVHAHGVAAVVIDDIRRDALAEIGLETIHAHVHQRPQLGGEPFA